MGQPRWRCRYSDSLRTGRSGYRIPAGGGRGEDICTLYTGPGDYLAHYTIDTGTFSDLNWPRWRGVDHPHTLVPRLKKEYSYTPIHPSNLLGLFHDELYYYVLLFKVCKNPEELISHLLRGESIKSRKYCVFL